jgi:hypothetical protein
MATDEVEVPRAIRRGPPITVSCECGQRRELRYGDRWTCDGCGRSYDTRRIPFDEYDSFRRTRARDRILPTAVFVILGVVVVVCVALGRPLAAIVLVPTVGFVWGSFVRPARRRRQYKAIAERPQWEIRAD